MLTKKKSEVVVELKKQTITSEVVEITPELATKWLEGNVKNRSIKTKQVQRYAKDMSQGLWVLNGEPIIFDEDGILSNGQHRLWAVIESGVPITSLVVRGAPREAAVTMDTGQKRSGSDQLQVAGFSHDHKLFLAASLRLVIQYRMNDIGNREAMAPAILVQAMHQEERLADFVSALCKSPGKLRGSVSAIAAVTYLGSNKFPDHADRFIDQWISGAGLPEGSPILALRQRFLTGKRLRPHERFYYSASSWNAFVGGRPLAHLRLGNKFPVIAGALPRKGDGTAI